MTYTPAMTGCRAHRGDCVRRASFTPRCNVRGGEGIFCGPPIFLFPFLQADYSSRLWPAVGGDDTKLPPSCVVTTALNPFQDLITENRNVSQHFEPHLVTPGRSEVSQGEFSCGEEPLFLARKK